MQPDDDPDAELLARLARQELQAARELVARKLPRLLALAQRLLGDRGDAEDVAQEAFVRIWKQAPRWRTGTARFDTWLHRVGLNLCYDRLRQRREDVVAEPPDRIDDGPTPEGALDAVQQNRRVGAALAALPARQREALVLQFYQGLSNAEAADLMDITPEALESLLARGRRNLRQRLAEPTPGKDTA